MANRHVTIPDDLDALRIKHGKKIPGLSALTQRALRAALRKVGVDVPELPEPARTAAATEAARLTRIGA